MHPVLFTINGVNFYSYGLFVALAFLIGYLILNLLTKNKNLPRQWLFEKLLIVLLAGIIGARLLYVILYSDQFTAIIDYFKIWYGGMVSFGGILGGLIAFIIIFRKNLWQWLDIFAVSFLAAAATWRMGCFLAGDHASVYSTAWYAINYEVPSILFEIIASTIGFIIAYILLNKKLLSTGYLFFGVFGWYGLERVIIDQFRTDPIFLSLKTGQWAGIIMLAIGIIGILTLIIYKKKDYL